MTEKYETSKDSFNFRLESKNHHTTSYNNMAMIHLSKSSYENATTPPWFTAIALEKVTIKNLKISVFVHPIVP